MTRPDAENPAGGFSGPSGGIWDEPLEDWQRDEGLAEDSERKLRETIRKTLEPGFMDEALTALGYEKDDHGNWRPVRPGNPPG